VLHVKHGHVLVKGELEPVGWCGGEEFEDLIDVEVVGDGEVVEVGVFHQEAGGDGVGDVEGEVAGFDEVAAVFVVLEGGEVTEEEAVGFGAFDEFEVAGFAGFEDTGGGERDLRFEIGDLRLGSEKGDGIFVAAGVFEVAVDGGDFAVEGGFDLGEGAAEDGERRRRLGRWWMGDGRE
jgi:hypothetical protein